MTAALTEAPALQRRVVCRNVRIHSHDQLPTTTMRFANLFGAMGQSPMFRPGAGNDRRCIGADKASR
jgi:hypothetical protein